MNPVGNLIAGSRRAQGLTLVSLAARIGYKNASKGARRIAALEKTGIAHPDLLRSVLTALSIDEEKLASARRDELSERTRAFLAAAKGQVQPSIRLRLIPGFHIGVDIPDDTSDADIEALAKSKASRYKCEAHVVLRSGISMSVNEAGEVVMLRERRDDGAPQESSLMLGPRSIVSQFTIDPEE